MQSKGMKDSNTGGYSNKIVVYENHILRIPGDLPLDRAAVLLSVGITMYSPLMHWNADSGKKVGIISLGSLSHIGVKIAHALGSQCSAACLENKKMSRKWEPITFILRPILTFKSSKDILT
jgi:uncharacterized zinc-type alcohol dehydrogenase-like protein